MASEQKQGEHMTAYASLHIPWGWRPHFNQKWCGTDLFFVLKVGSLIISRGAPQHSEKWDREGSSCTCPVVALLVDHISSLLQADRSQLSWYWNSNITQKCLEQKPLLLCPKKVWVFSGILRKDALQSLPWRQTQLAANKWYQRNAVVWKVDFSPHPEPATFPAYPSGLGQDPCPNAFLVLLITIAELQTHTQR